MHFRVALAVIALGGTALAGALTTQRAWSQGPGPQEFQVPTPQTAPPPAEPRQLAQKDPSRGRGQVYVPDRELTPNEKYELQPGPLIDAIHRLQATIRDLEGRVTALEARIRK